MYVLKHQIEYTCQTHTFQMNNGMTFIFRKVINSTVQYFISISKELYFSFKKTITEKEVQKQNYYYDTNFTVSNLNAGNMKLCTPYNLNAHTKMSKTL